MALAQWGLQVFLPRYLSWTVATVIGGIIAAFLCFVLGASVGSTFDPFRHGNNYPVLFGGAATLGAIMGLGVGAAQFGVLRYWLRRAKHPDAAPRWSWLLLSLAGGAVAGVLDLAGAFAPRPNLLSLTLWPYLLADGAVLGGFQWFSLRTLGPNMAWWIVATPLAWTGGLILLRPLVGEGTQGPAVYVGLPAMLWGLAGTMLILRLERLVR